MKITISGPAAAINSVDETEILDPQILRTCHGSKSEDSCINYLDDPLGEIGLIGGLLEIVFDEASQRLRVCTVYHSPRTLKKQELAKLVEETRGQWSDGIGEDGLDLPDQNITLDPYPVLAEVDLNDVTVEQIDDGVVVPKPRKSPLFAAVKKNDVAKIAKLLEAGEDINARDRHRETPLLSAVDEGHVDAVLLLIERGALLDVANKMGATPVLLATIHGSVQILEALLKAGANPEFIVPDSMWSSPPLHMACNRHKLDAARLLIEHGAQVNLACHSGYTAIMHLDENDVEIARLLISHGADTEAVNLFNKGMNATLKKAVS